MNEFEFEYDSVKSQINHEKHGIDFEEAQKLWSSQTAELFSSRIGEERVLVVGLWKDKFWTAIITKRENKIRIISVRRSRAQEVKFYEQRQRHQERH